MLQESITSYYVCVCGWVGEQGVGKDRSRINENRRGETNRNRDRIALAQHLLLDKKAEEDTGGFE